MLSDQIALFVVALLVALGAAMQAHERFGRATPSVYWIKASLGSAGVAAGVFITVFVLAGYGWGWPDLSRALTRTFQVGAGVAVGLLFSAFAWLVSGRFSIACGLVLLVNVGVAIEPSNNVVRLLGFSVGNYLVLSLWFARTERRRSAEPGS
jgi:hypothetical protein